MKIKLDLKKTLEENASIYFEKAKKARKKIEGVKQTIEEFEKKHAKEVKNQDEFVSNITKLDDKKKYWFEKFKWFVTSEGFLVIGARDATTNEIIIKKHTSDGDLVFHTDMAGSPFVVIKKKSKEDVEKIFGEIDVAAEIGDQSILEAASFCFAHSKAWKQGLSSAAVFWVQPDQVSKEAQAGESLTRGSFMIRGKTTYVDVSKDYAVGLYRQSVNGEQDSGVANSEQQSEAQEEEQEAIFISGPLSAIKTYATPIEIEQGRDKPSDVAKKVRGQIREQYEIDVPTDIVVRNLPQGIQLKKVRKRKKN